MKSRFSRLLTIALACVCGVMFLFVLLFQLGTGRGYHWWPADPDQAATKVNELDHSTFKLPPWSEFADINLRPVFNEDRKPTPPAPPEAAGHNDKPIPKLNVILSGVVITSKVRLAMVVENGKTQSMTLKEGQSLPGDFAAWSLARVKPRGAVFKNPTGEEVELELIAKGNGLKPPPPAPATAPAPAPGSTPAPEADAQVGKATEQKTELQQRVEARRKQLQEQADRAKQQNAAPQGDKQNE